MWRPADAPRPLVRQSSETRVRVFSLEQCVGHAFPTLDEMGSSPRLAAGSAATSHGQPVLPAATSCLWYRAEMSARQIPMLREHFADALGAAGWPDGACLFLSGGHTTAAGTGDDDSAAVEAVFFSPAAIAAVPHLIAVCEAAPSPPPARVCATLLVGTESDWNLLPCGLH